MFEQKFVRMAVSEGGTNLAGEYTPENRAQHILSFGIGFEVETKDEFMCAGAAFIKNFEAAVEEHIRSEREDADNSEEMVAAFQNLIEQSKQIDMDVFISLLSGDWDERHEYN